MHMVSFLHARARTRDREMELTSYDHTDTPTQDTNGKHTSIRDIKRIKQFAPIAKKGQAAPPQDKSDRLHHVSIEHRYGI